MKNDNLSDMLTRIRNANILHRTNVIIPKTKMNEEILNLFEKEGFIESLSKEQDGSLSVVLKYDKKTKKPCITNLQRISKSGLRIYSNYKEIPEILGGIGVLILSTSSDLLTDKEAKKQKIGGELLCSIW
jgi:small subunit ribosomal protein S8